MPKAPGNSPDSLLRPGAQPVLGYELVARLGAGGFGEVWKATAPGGIEVALKFVRLTPENDSGRRSSGDIELRALEIIKSIRHPHLLPVFGAWRTPAFLVIAMELANGTLRDRYQKAVAAGEPGIPRDEVLDYFEEAAKGIDFLNTFKHTVDGKEVMGVQHRDIKPDNILIVGDGAKVADFGLARMLEHSLTSHTGSLTIAYAAPEFFRGQTSHNSDQYCLAVAYCEMRGGRLPFQGTVEQIVAGHMAIEPTLTMLPEAERPIVAQALAKDPEKRHSNCRAFVHALRACRADRDTTPPPPQTSAGMHTIRPPDTPMSVKARMEAPTVVPGPTVALPPTTPPKPRRRETLGLILMLLALVAAAGVGAWVAGALPVPPPAEVLARFFPSVSGSSETGTKTTLPATGGNAPVTETRTTIPAKPTPDLKLVLPEEVIVKIGHRRPFEVKVQRSHLEGPVEVEFQNASNGLILPKLTIPADQELAQTVPEVSAKSKLGKQVVRVVAAAGEVKASAELPVVVERIATRIDAPDTWVIQASETKTFPFKLITDGLRDEVEISLEKLPATLSAKSVLIPANAGATVEVNAAIAVTAADSTMPSETQVALTGSWGESKVIRLKVEPSLARQAFLRAEEYRTKGKEGYPAALGGYSEAIRLKPDYQQAWYWRGIVYGQLNDQIKAIADFTEAIKLDPKDKSAYRNRGLAYIRRNDAVKGIADLNEAISLDPNDARAFYNRGVAHGLVKDLARAIADYTEAIRLNPRDAFAYVNRGAAFAERGDTDKAVGDFTEAIGIDPKHPGAFYNRATAYDKKGDLDRAIADYTEAIRLEPRYPGAHTHRGTAYAKKGDSDRAIPDYNEAIRLDPKDIVAYNNRGIAYANKNDLTKAIPDFTEAIRLDPKYATAFGNRGKAYYQQSNFPAAARDLTDAIKLEPATGWYYEWRARVYDKTGEKAKADADRRAAGAAASAQVKMSKEVRELIDGDADIKKAFEGIKTAEEKQKFVDKLQKAFDDAGKK